MPATGRHCCRPADCRSAWSAQRRCRAGWHHSANDPPARRESCCRRARWLRHWYLGRESRSRCSHRDCCPGSPAGACNPACWRWRCCARWSAIHAVRPKGRSHRYQGFL